MSSAFLLLLLLLFARSFRSFVRLFAHSVQPCGVNTWRVRERESESDQSCEGKSVELELVFMDSMQEI